MKPKTLINAHLPINLKNRFPKGNRSQLLRDIIDLYRTGQCKLPELEPKVTASTSFSVTEDDIDTINALAKEHNMSAFSVLRTILDIHLPKEEQSV